MKSKKMGIWLDHRRAVIVKFSASGDEITEILSHADRQPSRSDGVRSTAAFDTKLIPADDVKDRKFQQHLNIYYDEVISIIQNAGTLIIFGPGEAKGEFCKRLEQENPCLERVVHLETTDKMTHPQIAAKVRDFFISNR